MSNHNNYKVYFNDPNLFSKISEILEKNGIEVKLIESILEEESLIDIIFQLTKDFSMGLINENNLLLELQKKLSISPQSAQNIFNSVKERILPSAEKIAIEDRINTDTEKVESSIELIDKNQNIIEDPRVGNAEKPNIEKFTNIKSRIIKNKIKSSEISTKIVPNLIKKPDSYREPIE